MSDKNSITIFRATIAFFLSSVQLSKRRALLSSLDAAALFAPLRSVRSSDSDSVLSAIVSKSEDVIKNNFKIVSLTRSGIRKNAPHRALLKPHFPSCNASETLS